MKFKIFVITLVRWHETGMEQELSCISKKKERGEYEYALLDTGNRTIWNGVIANDITLYGGKYGSDSIHTKIERLHITFFAQSANEKNKIMTIFVGDKGENISFKITVVPTTGRVYIHEKK